MVWRGEEAREDWWITIYSTKHPIELPNHSSMAYMTKTANGPQWNTICETHLLSGYIAIATFTHNKHNSTHTEKKQRNVRMPRLCLYLNAAYDGRNRSESKLNTDEIAESIAFMFSYIEQQTALRIIAWNGLKNKFPTSR